MQTYSSKNKSFIFPYAIFLLIFVIFIGFSIKVSKVYGTSCSESNPCQSVTTCTCDDDTSYTCTTTDYTCVDGTCEEAGSTTSSGTCTCGKDQYKCDGHNLKNRSCQSARCSGGNCVYSWGSWNLVHDCEVQIGSGYEFNTKGNECYRRSYYGVCDYDCWGTAGCDKNYTEWTKICNHPCPCSDSTTTTTTTEPDNDPSGTLTISGATKTGEDTYEVAPGQSYTLTVSGTDDKGMQADLLAYMTSPGNWNSTWGQKDCDGSLSCTKSWTFSHTQEGDYQYAGQVEDTADQYTATDPASLTVTVKEQEKPACSVTATADPENISACDNQTTIGVKNLDGTSADSCTGTGTFTQTDSSHTYTVNCTGDADHRDCSSTVTVTKDENQPPSGTLTVNGKESITVHPRDSFTLKETGSDDCGVATLNYILKSGPDGPDSAWTTHNSPANSKNDSATWTRSENTVGTYIFKGYVYDNADPSQGAATNEVAVTVQEADACSVTATADPEKISPGDSTTISVDISGVDSCEIYPEDDPSDKDNISEDSPITVTPSSLPKTYIVNCTGDADHSDCSDTVTVNKESPHDACSVTATASPNPIPSGQDQVIIGKTGSGYSSCTGTGTFTQTDSSHTYTVNCTGDADHSDCSSTVTVTKESSSNACSVTATASPNPIPSGQDQVTIGKTGSGYSSCTGTGTFTQTDSSHTYTVNCTGDADHSDCSDTVTVNKESPHDACSVTATADPGVICVGGSTTISAENLVGTTADKCTGTGTFTPSSLPKTYTVNCTGDADHSDCSDTVTVKKQPCIVNLTASDDSGNISRFLGYPFTLKWTISGDCGSCSQKCYYQDSGDSAYSNCGEWNSSVTDSGSKELTPSHSGKYSYEIDCDNGSSVPVKAKIAPLPWWREIIPRLQGFLRGSLIK